MVVNLPKIENILGLFLQYISDSLKIAEIAPNQTITVCKFRLPKSLGEVILLKIDSYMTIIIQGLSSQNFITFKLTVN